MTTLGEQVPSQHHEPLDVEKLTLRDVLSGASRLTLMSVATILGILGTILAGAWALGTQVSSPVVAGDLEPCRVLKDSGGLTAARPRLSNEQLRDFIARAATTLTVVVPWFIDPLAVREALRPILRNPNATVDIFFLHPDSPHLAERGRVAQPNILGYARSETLRSITLLAPDFAQCQANAAMHVYDSIPSAFMVRSDEHGLIGFHMHTAVALGNPVLFFDMRDGHGSPTAMGAMVDGEFGALRRLSKTIIPESVVADGGGDVTFKVKP